MDDAERIDKLEREVRGLSGIVAVLDLQVVVMRWALEKHGIECPGPNNDLGDEIDEAELDRLRGVG